MRVVESRFPGVPGPEPLHTGLPLGSNRQRLNVRLVTDAHPGSGAVRLPGLGVRLSPPCTPLSGPCNDSPRAEGTDDVQALCCLGENLPSSPEVANSCYTPILQ